MMKTRFLVTGVLSLVAGCSASDRPSAITNEWDSGTVADSEIADSAMLDGATGDTATPFDDGDVPSSDSASADAADVGEAAVDDSASADGGADATPSFDGGAPLSDASVADSVGDDSAPGDVKPDPGPSCLPATTVTTSIGSLSSADDDVFAAVTPDERTLVFYRVSSAGAVTVLVSDRPTAKAAFPASLAVTTPPTGIAAKRMAISPDGLRLVVVSADGRSLRQLVRATRSAPFDGSADATPFANVNKLAADGPSLLGYPVLGSDDRTLYFTYGDPTVAPSIRRASRASAADPWSSIAPVEGSALAGTGTMGMVPTGISPDGRTLFVWALSGNREYAAYRESGSALFTGRTDLGDKRFASPVGDCLTLYYCAPTSAAGLDLFFDD